MGWNKVTKEELKEAGLDVEAFQAALTNANKVGDIESKITDLTTKIEGLAAIKTSLDGLENKLKDLGKTNGGNANSNSSASNSGGDNGSANQETLDWVLEPEKATKATILETIGPMANSVAEMRVNFNVASFKATNPKGFAKYEAEIMERFNKEPLQNRMHPDLIKNCYKVVIADHMDEITKGGESFFLETGGSTNGGTGGAPKKKAIDVLSKDELEQCTKWGVDPEEYLKEKQAGGVTSYA